MIDSKSTGKWDVQLCNYVGHIYWIRRFGTASFFCVAVVILVKMEIEGERESDRMEFRFLHIWKEQTKTTLETGGYWSSQCQVTWVKICSSVWIYWQNEGCERVVFTHSTCILVTMYFIVFWFFLCLSRVSVNIDRERSERHISQLSCESNRSMKTEHCHRSA